MPPSIAEINCRAYLAIFKARYRTLFQYKGAAAAGILTQCFWGLIRTAIYTAFYQSGIQSGVFDPPLPFEMILSYIWLGQTFVHLLPWMQDLEIRQLILEGHATYELSRPINLYAVWFSRMVAMRLCPISIRGSVIFFLAVSFFNLQGPASFLSFLAFALSILQALLISSSLSLFLILALFWTVSAENAIRALNPIMSLLSGIMVPIPFFPEAARFWAYCLPFCGIIDTPFRIYLGHIPIQEVPCALLHQTLWIVLLVASGQKLLQRALFKVNRSG